HHGGASGFRTRAKSRARYGKVLLAATAINRTLHRTYSRRSVCPLERLNKILKIVRTGTSELSRPAMEQRMSEPESATTNFLSLKLTSINENLFHLLQETRRSLAGQREFNVELVRHLSTLISEADS